MNSFGINEAPMTILGSIFSTYEQINKVLLYGSRAKGSYNERSDVDMVICCSNKIDRHILGKIILDVNNSNFPYTVDIQIFETLKNKKLIEHINRVGQVFYTKEP